MKKIDQDTASKERRPNAGFMTVSQAARHMGVGKKIIYQLIEFGELPALRERGAILVEKKSLENYRKSGKLT